MSSGPRGESPTRQIFARDGSVYVESSIASIVVGDLYEHGEPRTTEPVVATGRHRLGHLWLSLLAGGYDVVVTVRDEQPGDATREQVERVSLDWVHLQKGVRVFFLCPGGGKRAHKLHLHHARLRCGACAGLDYVSKARSPSERKLAAARRLREELGPPIVENGPPSRPKRMHGTTYMRKLGELHELELALFGDYATCSLPQFSERQQRSAASARSKLRQQLLDRLDAASNRGDVA